MRMLEECSFYKHMRSSIASTSCEERSLAFHGAAARRPPCARPPSNGPAARLALVKIWRQSSGVSLDENHGKKKIEIYPDHFLLDE
jgi:hypothetical protein